MLRASILLTILIATASHTPGARAQQVSGLLLLACAIQALARRTVLSQ